MDTRRFTALMKMRIRLWPFLAGIVVLVVLFNFNMVKYYLISTKKLAHANPISYTFHVSEDRLMEAARDYSFDDSQQSLREECPNPEGLTLNRHYAQFFVPPGQRPDTSYILALTMEPSFWQKSDMYFWRGRPLDYDADYQVVVTPTGDSMTQVRVETSNSQVDIGPVFSLTGGDLTKWVKPTTVEEYRFLLTVGCIVGETGMPPLELPR